MKPMVKKSLLVFFSFLLGGIIFTSCGGNEVISSSEDIISEKESSVESVHECNYQVVEKKDPNCNENGHIKYECNECDNSYFEEIPMKEEHSFSSWVLTIEPTYESEGLEERTCSSCGLVETKSLPMLERPDIPDDPIDPPSDEEHKDEHQLGYEVVDGMCHKVYCLECKNYEEIADHDFAYAGAGIDRCDLCGYEKIIEVECQHDYVTQFSDMEHYLQCSLCGDSKDFSPHQLTNSPYEGEHICGQQVQIEQRCNGCEFVKYKDIFLNHDYSVLQPYDETFCVYKCFYCSSQNTSNLIPHEIESSEVLYGPTCFSDGLKINTCKNCKGQFEEYIPISEHIPNFEIVQTITPTCSRVGQYIYQCTNDNCTNNYNEIYSGTVDHNLVETIEREPTCALEGLKIVRCSYNCNYYQEEVIEALPHNFVDNICDDCKYDERQDYFVYEYRGDYYIIKGVKNEYFEKFVDGKEEKVINFVSSYKGLPVYEINLFCDLGDEELFTKISQCDLVVPEGVTSYTFHTVYDTCRIPLKDNKLYLPSTITNLGGEYFQGIEGNETESIIDIYFNGSITDWLKIDIYNHNTLPYIKKFYTNEGDNQYTLLESLTIDSSIKELKSYSLKGVLSLKELVIPSTVEIINYFVIDKCSSLEKLTIPYIGTEATDDYCEFSIADKTTLTSLHTLKVTGGLCADISNLSALVNADLGGATGNVVATNCSKLETLVWSKDVTFIGPSAFKNCLSLKEIELPNGLESIYDNAFEGCSSLEKMIIPSSVTFIGDNVLLGCINVSEVALPKNVNYIGETIFSDCEKVTSYDACVLTNLPYYTIVDLFGNVGASRLISINFEGNHIPDSYFKDCTSLETINFSTTELSVGNYAFSNCSSLNNLPELTIIGDLRSETFRNCISLESIVLNNTLGGYCVFEGCTSLINATVSVLGEKMFKDCSSLTDVTLSAEIENIPNRCFYECSSLNNVNIIGDINNVEEYAFYNSGELGGFDLTTIKGIININAFENSGLKEISFAEGVTIYSYAFKNLDNKVTATILNDFNPEYDSFEGTIVSKLYAKAEIEKLWAFTSVEEIELEGSEVKAVFASNGVTKLTLKSGITKICSDTLVNLTSLTHLELPSSVVTLEPNCLPYSLQTMILNSNLPLYQAFNYYNDSKLYRVTIVGQNEILDNQFSGLKYLHEVKYMNGTIEKIGGGAFYGCKDLAIIPSLEECTYVGNNAFEGCELITKLEFSSDELVFEYHTLDNSYVKEIIFNVLPEGYLFKDSASRELFEKITILGETSIPDSMFQYCSGLEVIILNEGITSIGNGAFDGCGKLKEINLPSSLKTIGNFAFRDCSSLFPNITFGENIESIGEYAFQGCDNLYEVRNLSSIDIKSEINSMSPLNVVNYIEGDVVPFNTIYKEGNYYYIYNISLANNTIIAYDGEGGEIVLPLTIDEKGYYIHSLNKLTLSNEGVFVPSLTTRDFTSIEFTSGVLGANDYISSDSIKVLKLYTIFENVDTLVGNDLRNESIERIELLDGCSEIPDYAFENFYGVTTLFIPSSVTSIGEYYLSSGSDLLVEVVNESECDLFYDTIVNIYSSRNDYSNHIVKDGIFTYVHSILTDKYYLYHIENDNTYELHNLVVPATYNDKEVVVHNNAFGNSDWNSVTVSEGVKTLSKYVTVHAIDYVKLPSTITSVDDLYICASNVYFSTIPNVLYNSFHISCNSKIQDLSVGVHFNGTISEWLELVEKTGNIFYHNATLCCLDENGEEYQVTELDLTSTDWTTINSEAFKNYLVSSVKLPSTLLSIGIEAFSNNPNLNSVEFNGKVGSIGSYAFANCGFTTIDLSNVESIEEGAFFGNNKLTTVELSTDCKFIDLDAFNSTSENVNITINYSGTQEQFDAIEKALGWNNVYNSTCSITVVCKN